ncbi:MAG TPA: hypothetical protein VG125_26855 [Pirellulales bacterium]|jgi:hypothetical protein|nr:hypothetical protein [Pirellulales bacterium]
MALFGKDWNVLTLTFERADLLRVNGNRTKGLDGNKIRDNAKRHARTVYWAIFNQKGKMQDAEAGPGIELLPKPAVEKLNREWLKHPVVQEVLELLQKGEMKAARVYPPADFLPSTPEVSAVERTYKLVVASGEGEEFESTLKLTQSLEGLLGTLVSPDGDEVSIRDASLVAGKLSFEFTFGYGAEAVALRFHGTVRRDTVKGTFV